MLAYNTFHDRFGLPQAEFFEVPAVRYIAPPTTNKNVKRDVNAFDMLSASYFCDKSDNAPLDDSFILSEDNLPVVSVLEY